MSNKPKVIWNMKAQLLAILAGLPPDERKAMAGELREVAEAIDACEQGGVCGLPSGCLPQFLSRQSLSRN